MERELAVTAAFDSECFDDVERSRTEHLILFVRERYGRSDDDAVTGVYAYRIEVLHRADRENVACLVADDFELDLFPSCDALLDEYLRDR